MKDIEKYLETRPAAFREALEHVRSVVLAAAPDADEAMVYGAPGIKLNGQSLVCYASFKKHCGFYPLSPGIIEELHDDLKSFQTAKGTIRFQPDHPIPDSLITKMVRMRIEEVTG